ncbi:MAG: hypothetical protein ACYCZF_11945 [Anaerolineae bacterium]
MTTLVAWLGVDARKPASIYLASDSRISWSANEKWNFGRKLFASHTSPDLLGYCGEVLFPSQVFGQIIELIENGLLFQEQDTADLKRHKIFEILRFSLANYPITQNPGFTVVYCTREHQLMNSVFYTFTIEWKPTTGWCEHVIELPQTSGIIIDYGSGGKYFEKWHSYWSNTNETRPSRIVFSAFCDSLFNAEDPKSGGAPQLVGLYRKGNGLSLGVIYGDERYLMGLPVIQTGDLSSIEWRNKLFERCDGNTKMPLPQAQKHYHPRGLGKASGL